MSELKVTQRRYRKALHVTKMLRVKEEVELIFKEIPVGIFVLYLLLSFPGIKGPQRGVDDLLV